MQLDNIKGNFLFDMDEVLVDISPMMYSTIRMHWRKYSKWFRDLGPLTKEEIHARDMFYVDDWLMKDEIKNLPEAEYKKIKQHVFRELVNDFFNFDIYGALEPTAFARGTIMNPAFMDSDRVNKVFVLTRYITLAKNMPESKRKFVKEWFNHPKVQLVLVPSAKKKSKAIKELGVEWNILVDDELKNIRDFIENMDIEGKEFLVPSLGYNQLDPLTDIVIKEKGASISYF